MPKALPVKQPKEDVGAQTPDCPPPYAKEAGPEEDVEKGPEEPKVVTVAWPLLRH